MKLLKTKKQIINVENIAYISTTKIASTDFLEYEVHLLNGEVIKIGKNDYIEIEDTSKKEQPGKEEKPTENKKPHKDNGKHNGWLKRKLVK